MISEETVLRKLLQHMNSRAPMRREWLRDLMSSEDPHYVGKDGKEYSISIEELEMISEALGRRDLFDVKLPIVVIAEAGHEESVWKVEGFEECAVVSEVLGRSRNDEVSGIFLYAPHMALLRRKLPTSTVCLYVP